MFYTFKKQKYLIEDEDALRLFEDFKYCESIGDYVTINNRIINGLKWGWLIKQK